MILLFAVLRLVMTLLVSALFVLLAVTIYIAYEDVFRYSRRHRRK